MKKTSCPVLTLGLALAATGTAAAAKLKVPKQFGTIQAAVDAAVPGDTILVAAGTYSENVQVATNGLTLKGKGAVIDGNGDTCLEVTLCSGVGVEGFTFRNAGVHPAALAAVSGEVTFSRCTARDSGGDGITLSSNGGRVLDCRIFDVDGAGISFEGLNETVRGNRVLRTQRNGIQASGQNQTIEDNLVRASGLSGILVVEISGVLIADNRSFEAMDDGIRAVEAENIAIFDNVVAESTNEAIELENVAEGSVVGNVTRFPGSAGIELSGVSLTNLVDGNRSIRSATDGIHLLANCDGNVLRDNVVKKSGNKGVSIDSDFNQILRNKATGSLVADFVNTGSGNTVVDNVFPVAS